MVNRLNFPAGEGGVGHETSFRSTYFCKKGRKRSPATQEGSNQYGAEIHLRIKATHMLAPTRSALRVRRALFTNSHVSRKCRAYAVKSGFTPPEGNRYLLLISRMIAWRPHRCQWILVTPPIHYSNPCARGWEDSLSTSEAVNERRGKVTSKQLVDHPVALRTNSGAEPAAA
jgi:hypothetical protein